MTDNCNETASTNYPEQSEQLALPPVIDAQKNAVQPAPDQERPVRAVPETAQQHRDQKVHIAARAALAVAAQRNIQVIAQESRQRHVPAPPEIDDVFRFVGREEIDRQAQVETAEQRFCGC